MANDLPDDVLDRLADCRAPLLIGVRHHSAALARVMPKLLAEFKPKAILVEMPPDFQPWLEYLGKDDLEAPVALVRPFEWHTNSQRERKSPAPRDDLRLAVPGSLFPIEERALS